ncbi:MAG: ABC transporter permease [Tidjanibacter sp.]|nr:ABC transporter permease [Tidjanibacter sp.]
MRLWQTLLREIGLWSRKPILFVATLALPLFCLLFMATIFGRGEVREIPIGVIDGEFSSASRNIIRAIDASASLCVTKHYNNSAEALNDIRAANIFGYIEIPPLHKGLNTNGFPPTIAYYFHYAYMGIGGVVDSTLREIILTLQLETATNQTEQMGVEASRIDVVLSPIAADSLPIFNPTLNYRIYLSPPFFFILLQIVVLMVTIYTIGYDIEQGGGRKWMQQTGGRMGIAIVGKLLPYWLVFCAVELLALAIFFNWTAIPFGGSIVKLASYAVLLVSATQGVALLIYSIIPNTSIAMSVVSMIGSLGATLSGVTFPIGSLYPIFQLFAKLLPIRHFTLLLQSEMVGGVSVAEQWPQIAILLIYSLLPLVLRGRLKHIITHRHQ